MAGEGSAHGSQSTRMEAAAESEGRVRTVIENVTPQVDRGRFPVKRIVGDTLEVEADAFGDGHDEIRVRLRWRRDGAREWRETEMEALGNDRWRAAFELTELGRYEYSIAAWVDRFRTWQHDLAKRLEAGQDVRVDLLIGAALVESTEQRAQAAGAARDASQLARLVDRLRAGKADVSDKLVELVERYPDRGQEAASNGFAVVVDPAHARFSSWYELFPRSTSPDARRHGTFRDVVARLPYVRRLGFNVLYLPPIHPIGRQYRKGPNNVASQDSSDPGVPWAIGGPEGGHTAVHPQLGTLEDFRALVAAARKRRIEVALDIAFQASPDHPWVAEHPTWFRARPDGTIQYAENPPKKYQDIYPFDFESDDWRGLWQALNDVFRFWIEQGVTVFRVDNPHTKSFAFWEWCIADLKADHPEVLFLAEAFTRPKVMYRLAKLGFSQSYTYFTWRNSPAELREYLTELTSPPVNQFFRPNFWPNTPDILHADLQVGTRAAFAARLVLAATLSSNFGIYGPVFELLEHTPREAGSEEYLNSEKYQQRQWDLDSPGSLAPLITRVNAARRDHPALQTNERLWFHPVDNDALLAYTKNTADQRDVVLAVVNMDYVDEQAGNVTLDLGGLGLPADEPFEAVDLLDGQVYEWQGRRNWVVLDPAVRAAHLFWLRRPGSSGRRP